MDRTRALAGYINLIILLLFGCTAAGAILMVPQRTGQALETIVAAFEAVWVGTMWTAAVVFPTALVALLLVGLATGLAFVKALYDKDRLRQAKLKRANAIALKADREARVWFSDLPAGHQLYKHELSPGSYTTPLHLLPGRSNGEPLNYSPETWRVWQFNQLVHGSAPRAAMPDPTPAAQIIAGQPDLLTELDTVQRGLIVGPSDTGKTTLLQHIQARRKANSRVVAIDPHAYPHKWVAHKTFGSGRNYQEIDWGLQELLQLMIRRYEDIGYGRVPEMGHQKITLVIDEWRAIIHNVNDAGQVIKSLLTESRKAAFSVFVASHSERVRALGIEGEGDLKDGFAVVRLSIVNGQRSATIDKGNGEIPVALPGPFNNSPPPPGLALPISKTSIGPAVRDDTGRLLNPTTSPPKPDIREEYILKMHDEDRSHKEICESMGWTPGGKQYDRINQILVKFGRK